MLQKVSCIALRAVRYGEDGVMLSLWSREAGFLSASVRLGSGREASRRRALLSPPMAFEAVARSDAGSEVVRLSQIRALPGFASLSFSPLRLAVATFLAEVLSFLLRSSAPDPVLSEYVFGNWGKLAVSSGKQLANFHIVFLARLSRFLGIEPDVSTFHRGYCLNLREAVFSPSMPVAGPALPPGEARLAALLLNHDFDAALRLPLSRELRNRALDRIIEYYSLHHTPLTSLRSLDVLRQIFS